MTKFRIGNDSGNFHSSFTPPFSNFINTLVMTANVAASVVVPPTANKVFFNTVPDIDFWVDPTKTAVIPTGNIVDGSAPDLNPAGRSVIPEQVLSLITRSQGAIIHMAFYE